MFIDQLDSIQAGRILFEEPNDGGSGGSGSDTKPKNLPTVVLPEEVLNSLKGLVSRAGDESEALKILYADNKNLRDKLRDAEGQGLPEGKVAVDKDKAELIQTLEEREIKSKEDLTKTLENYDSVQAELNETKQQVKINTAQELYNVNAKVLEKLLKAENSVIELENGKDDKGNEVQKVVVVNDGKKTDLNEYAESNWAEFKPSLFSSDGNQGSPNTGRKFVKQGGSEGGGSTDQVKSFLEKRNERVASGNPLKGTATQNTK